MNFGRRLTEKASEATASGVAVLLSVGLAKAKAVREPKRMVSNRIFAKDERVLLVAVESSGDFEMVESGPKSGLYRQNPTLDPSGQLLKKSWQNLLRLLISCIGNWRTIFINQFKGSIVSFG
jgi:hypothetical protein